MLFHSINDKPGVTHPLTGSFANAAGVLTMAAVPGYYWKIHYANWRVSGSAPVGSSNVPVALKQGATAIYTSAIPAGSTNGANLAIQEALIELPINTAVTFDVASPTNAGCIIYMNLGLELVKA
jgi:hypothetical protein